ncbi:uncharacterized protein [Canis lupus baileyi]|uniref:uncharacterized protein LOC118353861 isoform X2 n=1 Tax=Canis lupus dingo TaxID=286419 RepID=UPI0015F1435C|nr:uncharacterized protein LOC118353861 isoform X2 [Canis lupus dingo]XP_038383138.1 uncharacterized protein LOC119870842 isoform X4 [Canis lupus familiaris]XP_038451960.1 uncharacterized protein LOC119870842 isoform X4 [Canis lupus familiaris]XP_038511251.1 uncharacterized protein LOC119870842 isoform X4 [Canis lupus familiaris]
MTMRRPTVLRSLQMGNNSSLDTCTWKIRRLTFIDHLIGFHAFWFPRVGTNGQRLESGRRTELLSAFMTTLRTKIYVLRMVEQENEKRLGPQCYHRAAEERREQISPQEGGRHKVKFLKASREVPLPSPLTQRRRKHPAPFGSHPERQACSSHPIPSGHKMDGCCQKQNPKKEITSLGEDVDKMEHLCAAGGKRD